MKNKKRKSFIALLALVVLSGLSAVSGTYAWWNTTKAKSDITIKVGERIALAVTPSVLSAGQLIPYDETPLANQVTAVTTSFAINVSGDVNLSLLQLKVTDEGRTFGGDAESKYVNYFVVKVGNKVINKTNHDYYVEDAAATMTVSVGFSLEIPEGVTKDGDLAEALSAKTFVITLGFEVLNKQDSN